MCNFFIINFNLASMITESIDKSINPCDNYYQYSCGNWINKHPVQHEDSLYGESHFGEVQIKVFDQLISNYNKITTWLFQAIIIIMNIFMKGELKNSFIIDDNQHIRPLINFFEACMNTGKFYIIVIWLFI